MFKRMGLSVSGLTFRFACASPEGGAVLWTGGSVSCFVPNLICSVTAVVFADVIERLSWLFGGGVGSVPA